MKVILAHNRYRSVGGEEYHIDRLEESLSEAGIDVRRFEIRTPSEPSWLERLIIGATLTYRPRSGRELNQLVQRERADIVHFHNIFPVLTPSALRGARLSGAGVVLTVHNYRFACPAGTLLRKGLIHEDCIEGSSLLCGLRNSRGVWTESIAYGVAIELQRRLRLLHKWVDAYVAPSRFVAMMLRRAGYPATRIHAINHGVVIDDEPSAAGEFVLYAGRLSSEKGIATLVDALRLTNLPTIIAGRGPLLELIRDASLNEVTYLGQVDQRTLARLRRGALLTVAPSQCYEAQPLGVLESMAAGTPVVASNLGGLAEIIEDGYSGLLTPPGDPGALANAMKELYCNRSRAVELGRRAWRHAQQNFCAATQASRMIELYEHVAAAVRDTRPGGRSRRDRLGQ